MIFFDINAKVCFMSSVAINSEALREVFPGISLGCFIRKPVTMDYLVKRIMAGIVFDEIIEKTKTDYNMLCEDEKHVLAEV